MYNKVLVPLDGSRLAEAALPYAFELAHAACSAEVVLLRVVEAGGDRELRRANAYLEKRAGRLVRETTPPDSIKTCHAPQVEWKTVRARSGKAANSILQFAEDKGVDLIILSTHGRSGIDRWLMGSVAEKVLRGADIPVVLVRASQCSLTPTFGLQRILVPLDGSELAERALRYVEVFGRTAGHEVTLLHVEPDLEGEFGADGKASAYLKPNHGEDVRAYLDSISQSLADSGVAVRTRVRVGHAGKQIVDEVQESAMDLVVMSSHGRTGLDEWAFGSIADQVLRTSPAPVLLVRAQVSGEVPAHLQGPLVYRCHHCGRRTLREHFNSQDMCNRCHYHFKSCGNCVYFDGVGCLLQLPDGVGLYPGNKCEQFEYRKTRLVLH